ncbi:NAD(P)H-quinone oxidoreductase [Klugiella xanthotipulae]|uniref:Putative PIG3 family NAD(P)H quinone oxidoreductase n=1 Tax=Klugiella xanthotipulae TaxID=244735 RepID=A0A543HXN7_9MICO|nr:NAD(P)H-quinone oxidoreductase [Klugiella xanthotipulae]TQM63124.1 putative PIG3 family NAD(P)H quinone oxidoreductase [Klugiella xanthotipulae]
MRVAVYTGAGGPEVIRMEERSDAYPASGEVAIRVAAAGLNRADVQQRRGLYPPPQGITDVPGLEVSGQIDSLGTGVTSFSVGDEVCALLAGGGYAERVVCPVDQVVPLPAAVSLRDAAALPEAAATVYSNLVMEAGVRAGDIVLVHGGAGGIGTMAVQLLRALGATCIVTAGSPEKLEVARTLGADVLINHRSEDFEARVHEATGGRGVDVILDVVGAAYLQRNINCLATGGRLVIIGLTRGAVAEINLRDLMTKRLRVIGTTLRARPTDEKAAIMREVVKRVWPLVAAGQIRPLVDRVFPLVEVAAAQEYFDSGSHTGKILLVNG